MTKRERDFVFLQISRTGAFVRACVDNDLRTVEKILQTSNGKDHLNDVNEDGDSVLALACSSGYTDLVRLLLTMTPKIEIDDRGTKQDCTPLMEGEREMEIDHYSSNIFSS